MAAGVLVRRSAPRRTPTKASRESHGICPSEPPGVPPRSMHHPLCESAQLSPREGNLRAKNCSKDCFAPQSLPERTSRTSSVVSSRSTAQELQQMYLPVSHTLSKRESVGTDEDCPWLLGPVQLDSDCPAHPCPRRQALHVLHVTGWLSRR